jgi:hypothetical protein
LRETTTRVGRGDFAEIAGSIVSDGGRETLAPELERVTLLRLQKLKAVSGKVNCSRPLVTFVEEVYIMHACHKNAKGRSQ